MSPHLGTLEQETLTYRWTHPDPRMDQLQERWRTRSSQAATRGEDAMVTFDRVGRSPTMAAGEPAHASVGRPCRLPTGGDPPG